MVNRSLSIACISIMSAQSTQHLVRMCHQVLSYQTCCVLTCCRPRPRNRASTPKTGHSLTRLLHGYQTRRDGERGDCEHGAFSHLRGFP